MSIGGKKVRFELVAEDDEADPKQGTAVAQNLADLKVNGVVGHLTSGTSTPASTIYSDAGIPQIASAATNPKFTRQGFKTTFPVVTDDVHLGGTLGRYAVKEQKGKSIAVIGVQPAVPFDFHAFDRQSRYDSPAAGSRRSRGLAVGQHDRVP